METEQPTVPPLNLENLANAGILEKAGDNIIEKAQQQAGTVQKNTVFKKRKSGKFNFVEPEKIILPSGGGLYKNITSDEDVLNGYIYMYPMTVKEEEILSTSRFLRTGAATRMVIDNCIASDIDAKDILLFDSSYLLFALRSISYGDEYKFSVKCSNDSCDREFDHTVLISELDFEELPEDLREPIKVSLPKSGYTVYNVLPRLFHSEEIYQQNAKRKKSTGAADTALVDNITATVVKITDPNGEPIDKKDYNEFFEALPGIDRATLKEATKFSTGVDTLTGVKCPYCETEYGGGVPVGGDFFRF